MSTGFWTIGFQKIKNKRSKSLWVITGPITGPFSNIPIKVSNISDPTKLTYRYDTKEEAETVWSLLNKHTREKSKAQVIYVEDTTKR